jgi:hypothetical protein
LGLGDKGVMEGGGWGGQNGEYTGAEMALGRQDGRWTLCGWYV